MAKKFSLMTDEERDNILLLLEKDLTPAQIVDIVGRSASVIRQIDRVYSAVKAGDSKEAWKQAMTSNNSALFAWACRKNGVDPVPPETQKAQEPPASPAPSVPAASGQSKPAATLDDVENAIHVAAMKQSDAVLPHLEVLEKKLDQIAVIIQSCAADGRTGLNVNADMIAQELRRQSDFLGSIKQNPRPRMNPNREG